MDNPQFCVVVNLNEYWPGSTPTKYDCPCQWHSEMKHILPALNHIKFLEQLSRINVTAIHGEKQ